MMGGSGGGTGGLVGAGGSNVIGTGGAAGHVSSAGGSGDAGAGGAVHDGGQTDASSDAQPAHAGAIRWARSGSAANFTGIAETPTGVLVTGFTGAPTDLGGGLLTPLGLTDGVVAEYSVATGSYMYASRFGASSPAGTGTVRGEAVVVDAVTGKPIIVGQTTCDPGGSPACNQIDLGLGFVTPGGGPAIDSFVGEYSVTSGQPAWVDRLAGPGADFLGGLANGPNQSVFVAGYYDQSANFVSSSANKMLVNAGDRDIVVGQINAPQIATAGGIGLVKTISDSSFEQATSVTWTGTQIVAAGIFNGMTTFGSKTLTSQDFDIWVAKLSAADGTPIWAVRLGGAGPDKYPEVAVDASGGIYVAASITGSVNLGSFTVGGAGGIDTFLAKLSNADGSVVWATSYGSSGDDQAPQGLAIDSSGEILVAGGIAGPIEANGPFMGGSSDAFFAAYNGAGTRLWTKVVGTAGSDVAGGVAAGSGAFYVTANLGGSIGSTLEGVTIQGAGSPVGLLLKVEP
jgi:hypothetical protein